MVCALWDVFIPSRELAKQAVTTKCRDNINAEPSRAFIKYKAVDFRAKNKNLCKSVDKKNSVDNKASLASLK